MNGIKIVFDTCAAIKLLEEQYDLALLGINISEAQFFTSVIVRMELLSKRQMQEEEKMKKLNKRPLKFAALRNLNFLTALLPLPPLF